MQIDIFLWPYLTVLLEHRLYDAREPSGSSSWWPFRRRKSEVDANSFTLPADIAISIRNLEKTFSTSFFGRKQGLVTAVSGLSIDIPKSGIFVLLGSNG
jgi:ATP-binding cassette subfamily A (ABC1) protein 3